MRYHSPKRQPSTRDLRETRRTLAARCDGRCEHCGYALPVADDGTPVFSIHHRLSRAQGGGDGPENTLAVLIAGRRVLLAPDGGVSAVGEVA